ncbi:hypothetical protein [Companilactobacillus ginsenosidimutans]|uniref:Uncharacterized protein n=1 Tax=Companilactobacillus ginsenosidimutans TaxID=1007676 RepID=A0A0H4QI44_9LACO|nr:hypothetical protein [Companilactobacillus ginsenosidimutans]AKP67612.1 hypothetical protein ABM34_08760 [Companilactobacillus ginsenosidimutans]
MSKSAKIGLISFLLILAVFAGYFSYTSYSTTSVNHTSKTSQSNTSTANANTFHKPKKSKIHENEFFVDTNKPDRIIAVNPHGSKGVYQYRQQADGKIYPEFKFFNGSLQQVGGKLIVSPTNSKSPSESFVYEKQPDGNYKEQHTNETYMKYDGFAENNKPHKNGSAYQDTINEALDNPSDPSHGANNTEPFKTDDKYISYRLKNGDYYQPFTGTYYGKNWATFDYASFDPNDKSKLSDNSNRVMSYKQNNVTELSEDEIKVYKSDYNSNNTLFSTLGPNAGGHVVDPSKIESNEDWGYIDDRSTDEINLTYDSIKSSQVGQSEYMPELVQDSVPSGATVTSLVN